MKIPVDQKIQIVNHTPTSKSTVQLLEDVISNYAFPKIKMIFDNSTVFKRNEFKELWTLISGK